MTNEFREGAWGIWYQVSGGVTGTREAWLKSDGQVQRFKTKDDAEAAAATLELGANGSPRKADFKYRARRLELGQ